MVFVKWAWRRGSDLFLTFLTSTKGQNGRQILCGSEMKPETRKQCHGVVHLLTECLPSMSAERSPSPLKTFMLRNHTSGEALRQTCRHPALPFAVRAALTSACAGRKSTISCTPEQCRNPPSACLSEARL